ncbi:transcription antitermination factor NusB [Mumia sp. zg.B53]|uniref:transcription antitermination factor NusB n=1 Tax=unclassified Mumia TaxID=2621872 RepID=UPI001C6F1DF1|nr:MULTISPECIES: transcription antitermination factor NusB [unclassified Mumia]MBW9206042.1 transcription antitermination factor NusB [Mumia sp. zg.B17]MBW9211676.1 transcription antitermination factor NusB [Mumia sp. zg.B21]MBW9216836.1 transcription antitermination factor NusB [Mumia sp. zg.B53]MDD9350210.1 transcription antitermination factor NusB [Mumia sp.]
MAGSRTKARKRALDVLFESELQSRGVGATLDGRVAAGDPPVNPYTIELVEGVREHRDRIDALLEEYAQGWTLDRMPAVDRNLLRIGVYEVLYRDEVPDAVAVSEATNLAAELSTDDSPSFVQGLLSRIVEVKPTLSV